MSISSARIFTNKNLILVVFFIFITISLFLGDGKQPFVDIWWALGILMMYGVRYYQRGHIDLCPPPRFIGFAWTILILYYIVLIPFSDSAGYSITATMRFIEGYLVFIFFYTISSESVIAFFTKGLIVVGGIAIIASWVFMVFPTLASYIPLMNLLYANYGHNHLADLLLPIFPLLVGQLQHKPSKWSWFLFGFYIIGMVLTFARGAWILFVGYLVYVWIKNRKENLSDFRIALLSTALILVVIFSGISIYSTKHTNNNALFLGIPSRISRFFIKPSFREDGRLKYWKQAVLAIKERPLFGSGPGTFYLQSLRLQETPSSFSWFAHNFPLETVVEVGIIGTIFLLLVLVTSFRLSRMSFLFVALCLTILYSFFEFNLNYTVVWVLLWAMLGVCLKDKKINNQKHWALRGLVAIGLIVLCIFYVTSMSSVVLDVVSKKKLAFYVAPYIATTTKNHLEQLVRDDQKLTPIEERIILGFHKKDPEVLTLLAQQQNKTENFSVALQYYKLVKNLDPQSEEFQKTRMEFYLNHKEYRLFFEEYKSILLRNPNNKIHGLLDGIIISSQDIAPKNYELLGSKLNINKYSSDEVARSFFLLGFSLVDAKPLMAKKLFILARDLAPTWSYFHLALSSYYHYYEDQKELAQEVLKNCLRFEYAGGHCADVMALSIPSLNEIKDYVLTMP